VWAGHSQGPWKSAGLPRWAGPNYALTTCARRLRHYLGMPSHPASYTSMAHNHCAYQDLHIPVDRKWPEALWHLICDRNCSRSISMGVRSTASLSNAMYTRHVLSFSRCYSSSNPISFTPVLSFVAQYLEGLPHIVQPFSSFHIRFLLRAFDEHKAMTAVRYLLSRSGASARPKGVIVIRRQRCTRQKATPTACDMWGPTPPRKSNTWIGLRSSSNPLKARKVTTSRPRALNTRWILEPAKGLSRTTVTCACLH